MSDFNFGIWDYFFTIADLINIMRKHSKFIRFSNFCCWKSVYSLCNTINTNRALKTSSPYSDGCVDFQKETHADLLVTNLRIVDPLNFLTARDMFTCTTREDPLTCVKHGLRPQAVSVNPRNTMRYCQI